MNVQLIKASVGLPGRDQINLELDLDGENVKSARLTGIGCSLVLDLLVQWRPKLIGKVKELPLPQGHDHGSLLMRQLLLQVQNSWKPPYQDIELCHCRAIATDKINMAIIAGAHTPELVSKKTSASTACGTCRPHVEAQIEYFLNSSKKVS